MALKLPADSRNEKEKYPNSTFSIVSSKDDNTDTVKFLTVHELDEGEYYCEANNQAGRASGELTMISIGKVAFF
jgi:hypothetical protein